MAFQTPFTLLLLSLLLTLCTCTTPSTALTPVTRPLRLSKRCRPSLIQRDALCACQACTIFGLVPRSFTRRCARIFRATPRAMRRSCASYTVRTPRGRRFQSRRLIRNLRFIDGRCADQLSGEGKAVGRILTEFQVRRRIDRILGIVREVLGHLQPMPVVTTPPSRMIVGDGEGRKVARLREYNHITE